jgi:hypothetical protein
LLAAIDAGRVDGREGDKTSSDEMLSDGAGMRLRHGLCGLATVAPMEGRFALMRFDDVAALLSRRFCFKQGNPSRRRSSARRFFMSDKKKHGSSDHHHNAAAEHQAAAHHHHQAAHHHDHGDHEEAKRHAISAQEHSEQAGKHTQTAHQHSHK